MQIPSQNPIAFSQTSFNSPSQQQSQQVQFQSQPQFQSNSDLISNSIPIPSSLPIPQQGAFILPEDLQQIPENAPRPLPESDPILISENDDNEQSDDQSEEEPELLPESNNQNQQSIVKQAHTQISQYSNLHVSLFPLISEYITVAHSITWGIVTGKQTTEMYRMLISCAIAGLWSILSQPNLHPFIEIQVRLKLASILSEESVNWEDANRLVNKGVSLAKSHNYLGLAMQLKYLSIKTMAYSPGTSLKMTLKMLDTAINESRVLAEESEDAASYFAFLLLKTSLLFNSNTPQDTNEGIQQLVFLQEFKSQQDHIAHLAYTMHALKLFQSGTSPDEILTLIDEAKHIEQLHGYIGASQNTEKDDQDIQLIPSPQGEIKLQQIFMRIICETLIHLEFCNYDELLRVEKELFQIIDSPLLTSDSNLDSSGRNESWPLDAIEIPLAPFKSFNGKKGNMKIETSSLQHKTVTVSWLSLSEARILSYMISGLAYLGISGKNKHARGFLKGALNAIEAEFLSIPVNTELNNSSQFIPSPMNLETARSHHDRLRIMQCHTLFLLSLERFLMSKWNDDGYLQDLLRTAQLLPQEVSETFLPLTFYLSGVFFQASGNMHNAIQFYIKIRQHYTVAPNSELYILATINLVLVLEGSIGKKYNNFKVISNMEKGNSQPFSSPGRASASNSIASRNGSTGGESNSSSTKGASKAKKQRSKNGMSDQLNEDPITGRKLYSHKHQQQTEKEETSSGAKFNETPSSYYRQELLRPMCINHPSPMIQWAIHLLETVYDKTPRSHQQNNMDNQSSGYINGSESNILDMNNKLSILLAFAMKLNNFQVSTIAACISAPGVETTAQRFSLIQRGLSNAIQSQNALWGWMNGTIMATLQREMGNKDIADQQKQKNDILKRAVEDQVNRVD